MPAILPRLSLLGLLLFSAGTAAAAEPNFVIFDNDFEGPGGTNIQSVIPLLGAHGATVLGMSVVTGDGWQNAEIAHLSRFLEIAGNQTTPVIPGAVYPLVNSRPRLLAWEKSYGAMPWIGAWRHDSPDREPAVPTLKEGAPSRGVSTESAAQFMIRAVHAHPHQVTIIAAGPMTDLALAIRLDPSFASLARQLVFMGAIIDSNLAQVTASADYNTDFNMMFDAEAADITLTADWPKITAVGAVANNIMMTRDTLGHIVTAGRPVSAYLEQFFHAQPMWDELTVEVALDPSLITKEVSAFAAVDLSHGVNYGYVHVWPEMTRPHLGERPIEIVTEVDSARFIAEFVEDARTADRLAAGNSTAGTPTGTH